MAARGLSQQQAVAAISAWPETLVMNMAMPSKVRKLVFLQRVIGQPVADLARSPSYLAYSLETRIAPRTCFRLEQGMDLGPTLSYLRDGGLRSTGRAPARKRNTRSGWRPGGRRLTAWSGAARRTVAPPKRQQQRCASHGHRAADGVAKDVRLVRLLHLAYVHTQTSLIGSITGVKAERAQTKNPRASASAHQCGVHGSGPPDCQHDETPRVSRHEFMLVILRLELPHMVFVTLPRCRRSHFCSRTRLDNMLAVLTASVLEARILQLRPHRLKSRPLRRSAIHHHSCRPQWWPRCPHDLACGAMR